MKKKYFIAIFIVCIILTATLVLVFGSQKTQQTYSFDPVKGISLENNGKKLSELGKVASCNDEINILMIPASEENEKEFYLTAISDKSKTVYSVTMNSNSFVFLDNQENDITDQYTVTTVEDGNLCVFKVEPKNAQVSEVSRIKMTANCLLTFEDVFSLSKGNQTVKLADKYDCSIEDIKITKDPQGTKFLEFTIIYDENLTENSIFFSPGTVLKQNGIRVTNPDYKSHEANKFYYQCSIKDDKPSGDLSINLPNIVLSLDADFS